MELLKTERIILPGDGDKPDGDNSDPTIVIQEGVRTIEDTTLADAHAPTSELRRKVAEGKEDWGDGFFMEPEPVLVQRAPDGSIVRTTPLSEIPGVHFERGGLVPNELTTEQKEAKAKVVDAKPTPVPLTRDQRYKLVEILAGRLFRYYQSRGPMDPRFNPFRDGIPDLPAGSPEHLEPLPGTDLYPATDAQIMDWLRRFVGERAEVINRNRFGGGIEDYALRIN